PISDDHAEQYSALMQGHSKPGTNPVDVQPFSDLRNISIRVGFSNIRDVNHMLAARDAAQQITICSGPAEFDRPKSPHPLGDLRLAMHRSDVEHFAVEETKDPMSGAA